MRRLLQSGLIAVSAAHGAEAAECGERHLLAHEASAAFRDAEHRDDVRITVWYPATQDVVEEPLDIGPPGKPFFKPGSAAPNAPFIDQRRRATVLFSHGFGGSARVMGWFGIALARHGYIVVAVDHPGNNARDRMTVGGAALFWERPKDLAAALTTVEDDPVIAPHIDRDRIGVAGFSAGGFTSLVAVGARVNLQHLQEFCAAHPEDGVCAPQKELAITQTEMEQFVAQPAFSKELPHASDDMSIPGVKAAYIMAPALVQSVDTASLHNLSASVSIILGDADRVAPPATNGEHAARAIPGVKLRILPRVGHYDFLAECTKAGDAAISFCPTKVPRQETHKIVTNDALSFFDATLGGP